VIGHVEFYCEAPEHQTWTPGHSLTFHADRWAYCPTGQEDGHAWQLAGSMSLIELKRRLAKAAA